MFLADCKSVVNLQGRILAGRPEVPQVVHPAQGRPVVIGIIPIGYPVAEYASVPSGRLQLAGGLSLSSRSISAADPHARAGGLDVPIAARHLSAKFRKLSLAAPQHRSLPEPCPVNNWR